MAFIVEMTSKAGVFTCSAFTWEELLKPGEEHGWKSLGTVPPDKRGEEDWANAGGFENNYKSEEWLYAKQILAEDAERLAVALAKALEQIEAGTFAVESFKHPTLIREDMTAEEYASANRGISSEFLKDFIAYLRQGSFVFAWDD